ncbi:hypothetical protein HZY97_16210 [Sphingomonas sp. R-74633]|uniref:hypothetical protein n=1 Tax=Sphingomonas sp. R-74633 TaxID=2751188 RepID=UPI0015D12362|nr:hypothetical protein [Sphingomonas sp. R-74633]NYT42317.1 hypothetical protein [Sphingomonas sp. R-74633]
MIYNRRPALAGIRITAAERRMGRLMRAPDGHGDDDGGGGGGDGGGDDLADPPADPPADTPPWYGDLSADAKGSAPSDRDWMTGKGFTDPAAMVQGYRALETKLGERKGIEIPGDDATDEAKAAYRAAIGVPDSAEGYAVNIPEGWEADMAILGPLSQDAHEIGAPKAVFDALAEKMISRFVVAHNALVTQHDSERAAVEAGWGGQKAHNLELYRRGMVAFGFTAEEAEKMQVALGEGGTRKMMEAGLKLGQLSNEDGFIPGSRRDFGITPDAARIKLAEREKDREWVARLQAKDPATVAEHARLVAVTSEDDERKAREARAA